MCSLVRVTSKLLGNGCFAVRFCLNGGINPTCVKFDMLEGLWQGLLV